jgi:WD40 repeat protein
VQVCCADFDAEDTNVATVGVSKIVKVFDIGTVLDPNFSSAAAHSAVHIPIWQASARSKLSSVAWNSYIRSYLVTADYDGSIQLWDTAAVARSSSEVSHFEEHSKRVWSVDFSRLDPPKFLSGSDDGTVRLWSITQESSAVVMRTPANVCSVQFSNHSNHLIAAGCANHRVYLFDLRRPDCPAAIITGPRKAVSYVRFVGNDLLCAASTDSTIRLWNVDSMLEKQNSRCTAEKLGPGVVRTLTGHVNERNFVGLSTSRDGYILTGSEDNCVYAYYKNMNFPISKFSNAPNNANVGEEGSGRVGVGKKGFISSVSWARASRRALIADSRGGVRLLDFVSNSV